MMQKDECCILVVDVGEADAIHRVADSLPVHTEIKHPARVLRSRCRHLDVVARAGICIAG